jgi:hypothetical protein
MPAINGLTCVGLVILVIIGAVCLVRLFSKPVDQMVDEALRYPSPLDDRRARAIDAD